MQPSPSKEEVVTLANEDTPFKKESLPPKVSLHR